MNSASVIPAKAGIQGDRQVAPRSGAGRGGAPDPLSLQGERARVRVLRRRGMGLSCRVKRSGVEASLTCLLPLPLEEGWGEGRLRNDGRCDIRPFRDRPCPLYHGSDREAPASTRIARSASPSSKWQSTASRIICWRCSQSSASVKMLCPTACASYPPFGGLLDLKDDFSVRHARSSLGAPRCVETVRSN